MKTKLLALAFLAGTTAFAGPRFFFGYAPAPVAVYGPPPVAVRAYAPPAFVAGYYAPVGPRWVGRGGYWARPPYARSYWVAPRYFGGRYYGGYWRR